MKKALLFLVGLMMVFLVTGCGGQTKNTTGGMSADGKVTIELYTNKLEAIDTVNELITKFEKENPSIHVQQVQGGAEPEVLLKTRVSKKEIPDVMAIGLNATFGELARANVFSDLSDDPALKSVIPAYVDMVKQISELKTVTGIPYATNADTVLYNKKIFREMGLTTPKTWDEFIVLCDKIKASGKVGFYWTLGSPWAALIPYNAIASNLQGEHFIEKRRAGETSFVETHQETAQKMLKLLEYGHKDNAGKTYEEGNVAFAKGESVMYFQGIWAIAEVKKANPDIELGAFALPVINDPAKNKMISGVDVLLTMSKTTKHPEEVQKFIAFMMKPENVKIYADQQKLFSAVKGVSQDSPEVVELKPYFESGQIVDFCDHYYPSAMRLNTLVQEFTVKKDIDGFLKTLDREWDNVQKRK